jgi:DNA-binding LacI/PurR family transcriptional regulator
MKIRTWAHAQRNRGRPPKQPTVGVVIDCLVDGYQRILFDSIARSAREQGLNVVAFSGGRLPSPLFDLIDRANADALILVGSTTAHQVGTAGLADFCRQRAELPICCVGIEVEGVPSIVASGASGVHALVTHLVTDHGRRHLAFIKGLGADGAERLEAFETCLNEFGVPLRDSLIVDGKYTVQSGRDAIRVLCDERRVSFDGVVAADDYMALGAIEALEERGFVVPRDVAVVGFDDIEDARNGVVPLTTVQQPIRELGRRAVQLCQRQLERRDPDVLRPIICHPIKRRSCGCVVETPFTRRPSNLAEKFPSSEAALIARRDLVLADMLRTAQEELGSVGYHWEDRLFNGIVDELKGATGNPFLSVNEELARRVFRSSGDVSTWQRVLAALRHHVLDCIGDNQDLRSAAESAFHDAFLVSANVVGREEAHRRTHLEFLLRTFIRTGNELATATDESQTPRVLLRQLETLGVLSCYLSVYADAERTRSRLLLGYDHQLPVQEAGSEIIFDTRELVPAGLLPHDRSYAFALLPLARQGRELGFVLFEYQQQDDALLFEVLRDQMSTVLPAD